MRNFLASNEIIRKGKLEARAQLFQLQAASVGSKWHINIGLNVQIWASKLHAPFWRNVGNQQA